MRATKAYIASAGTAAVMLAASLSAFALMSAYIAFGSWPGTQNHTNLDQVVLGAIERPHSSQLTVSKDAVAIARRDAARRAARTLAATAPGIRSRTPVVTVAPASPGARAPVRQLAAAPTGNTGRGGSKPAPDVTQNVTNTTQQVTNQVQNQVQQVQQQVDQVVQQVIDPGATNGAGGGSGSGSPVQTVTNGSVLGH
jgi:hypothetical protein